MVPVAFQEMAFLMQTELQASSLSRRVDRRTKWVEKGNTDHQFGSAKQHVTGIAVQSPYVMDLQVGILTSWAARAYKHSK